MKIVYKKTKTNEHVYLLDSYRIWDPETGKSRNTSRIAYKFGTVSELKKLHPNLEEFLENEKIRIEKETQENKEKFSIDLYGSKLIEMNQINSFNAGSVYIKKVLKEMKILDFLDSLKTSNKAKYKFKLSDIVTGLICNSILTPSSKKKSVENIKNLIIDNDYELHDIYRSLDILAENMDAINAYTYKRLKSINKLNSQIYYYDCTNFYFTKNCDDDFKKNAKSKEGIYAPLVQMGLLIDNDSFLIGMVVFEGAKNEQPSLKLLEKKLKEKMSLNNVIICTDAGLGSADNRYFNTLENRSFICTHSLKSSAKFVQEWVLTPSNWRENDRAEVIEHKYELLKEELQKLQDEGNEIEAKKIEKKTNDLYEKVTYISRLIKEPINADINDDGIKEKVTNFEQKIIVTFSLKYKKFQEENLQKEIDRANAVIMDPKKYKDAPDKSFKRFIKNLKFTKEGELANNSVLELKQQAIEHERKWFGYYCVATNIKDETEEIIRINKFRWQVEYVFRTMKTNFRARPIHVSKKEHIIGHFEILFLTINVFKTIQLKLYKQYGVDSKLGEICDDYEFKNELTVDSILETLRKMNLTRISSSIEAYIPSFTRTKLTDAFADAFDVSLSREVIFGKTLKKIKSI